MIVTSDMRSVPAGQVGDDDQIIGVETRSVGFDGLHYWILPGRADAAVAAHPES